MNQLDQQKHHHLVFLLHVGPTLNAKLWAGIQRVHVSLILLASLRAAVPNVSSIQSVQVNRLASIKGVRIHALARAELMLSVMSRTMFQFARVFKVMKVILLLSADLFPPRLKGLDRKISAILRHVEKTPSATMDNVPASQNIMAIPTPDVVRNASLTTTALATKLVYEINVSIHVLARVVRTPGAKLSIIFQRVHVQSAWWVMRSIDAHQSKRTLSRLLIHVAPHLVDQTLSVETLTRMLFAHVFQPTLEVHQIANRSVSSAQNAFTIKLASIRNASILVQEHVGTTLVVRSSTTVPYAVALLARLEIHSKVASKLNQIRYKSKELILVYQVLVGRILDASLKQEDRFVNALLDTLELHQIVGLNVSATMIVQVIKHVLIISATIHVQEFVERMLNAELLRILFRVLVQRDTAEMHLYNAFHKYSATSCHLILVNHHHADQMQNVSSAMVRVHANVFKNILGTHMKDADQSVF